MSRSAAFLTLCILAPLFFAVAVIQKIRTGKVFAYERNIRLDRFTFRQRSDFFYRIRFCQTRTSSNSNLSHFVMELMPGLINIVRGDIGWFGISAVSQKEFDGMLPEWQDIYRKCQLGLITESLVMYGRSGTVEEKLAAEIFGAVTGQSHMGRIRRLFAYIESLLLGPKTTRYSANSLPAS